MRGTPAGVHIRLQLSPYSLPRQIRPSRLSFSSPTRQEPPQRKIQDRPARMHDRVIRLGSAANASRMTTSARTIGTMFAPNAPSRPIQRGGGGSPHVSRDRVTCWSRWRTVMMSHIARYRSVLVWPGTRMGITIMPVYWHTFYVKQLPRPVKLLVPWIYFACEAVCILREGIFQGCMPRS